MSIDPYKSLDYDTSSIVINSLFFCDSYRRTAWKDLVMYAYCVVRAPDSGDRCFEWFRRGMTFKNYRLKILTMRDMLQNQPEIICGFTSYTRKYDP